MSGENLPFVSKLIFNKVYEYLCNNVKNARFEAVEESIDFRYPLDWLHENLDNEYNYEHCDPLSEPNIDGKRPLDQFKTFWIVCYLDEATAERLSDKVKQYEAIPHAWWVSKRLPPKSRLSTTNQLYNKSIKNVWYYASHSPCVPIAESQVCYIFFYESVIDILRPSREQGWFGQAPDCGWDGNCTLLFYEFLRKSFPYLPPNQKNSDDFAGEHIFNYNDYSIYHIKYLPYLAEQQLFEKITPTIGNVIDKTVQAAIKATEVWCPKDYRQSLDCQPLISCITKAQTPTINIAAKNRFYG